MAKLAIIGHISIDTIIKGRKKVSSLGGSPSYAGLSAKAYDIDVYTITKYGKDLPEEMLAILNDLKIVNGLSKKKRTTKFKIILKEDRRELFLLDRCEKIKGNEIKGCYDGILISPIADELDCSVLQNLNKLNLPLFLDPQGLLRRFGKNRKVMPYLSKDFIEYAKLANFIKIGREELEAISMEPRELLKRISSDEGNIEKGIIYTKQARRVAVILNDKEIVVKLPKIDVVDTTGAGDILMGTFATQYLKTKDITDSILLSLATTICSLDRFGIEKVLKIKERERKIHKILNKIKVERHNL
jgi:sugar/nucleoside kinase (ribokinase family)